MNNEQNSVIHQPYPGPFLIPTSGGPLFLYDDFPSDSFTVLVSCASRKCATGVEPASRPAPGGTDCPRIAGGARKRDLKVYRDLQQQHYNSKCHFVLFDPPVHELAAEQGRKTPQQVHADVLKPFRPVNDSVVP